MKLLKFVFVIAALAVGCKKDAEEIIKEVEKTTSWTSRKWFSEGISKIKINSHATDDDLFLYGPDYFNTIHSDGTLEGAVLSMRYPEFHRLPITDTWFVETDEHYIRFSSTRSPITDGASKTIDLKGINPDFSSVYVSYWYGANMVGANDVDECLATILIEDVGFEFYRFKVGVSEGLTRVSVSDTTKIDLPDSGSPQAVLGNKDYFIISFSNVSNESRNVYKIYPDGSYKKVSDQYFYRIYKISGDRLLATGTNYPAVLHFSDDDGETWTSYSGVPIDLVMMDYTMVGDSIVGSNWSNLYSIKYEGTNYSIRTLDNGGLETSEITSVAGFRDSVFTTTYGGVFVRSKADFFKSKPADE